MIYLLVVHVLYCCKVYEGLDGFSIFAVAERVERVPVARAHRGFLR